MGNFRPARLPAKVQAIKDIIGTPQLFLDFEVGSHFYPYFRPSSEAGIPGWSNTGASVDPGVSLDIEEADDVRINLAAIGINPALPMTIILDLTPDEALTAPIQNIIDFSPGAAGGGFRARADASLELFAYDDAPAVANVTAGPSVIAQNVRIKTAITFGPSGVNLSYSGSTGTRDVSFDALVTTGVAVARIGGRVDSDTEKLAMKLHSAAFVQAEATDAQLIALAPGA